MTIESAQDSRVIHGARQFERRALLGDLDGRERETKLLKREVADLIEERGGDAMVSVGERTLIDRAAFKSVLCQIVESWVLQQQTPIKDGALLPVLGKQYLAWSNSLRRDLEVLGLRPERANKLPSLSEYLEQRHAGANDVSTHAMARTQAHPARDTEAPVSREAAASGQLPESMP